MRRFLGMTNSLGRFIPNLATVIKPLTLLLHKDTEWIWDYDQKLAFDQLKQNLISSPVLALYDQHLDTCIQADSSGYGLGAVLCQKVDDIWKPVSYASRSLTPTESRYATIEKEALAITWACERFHQYLFGKEFTIYTDHSPLVTLLSKKRLDEMPLRVQRFRLRLMRYNYEVIYIPGSKQTIADTLSRAPVEESKEISIKSIELSVEIENYVQGFIGNINASEHRLKEIQQFQNKDPVLKEVKKFTQSHWPKSCAIPLLPYYSVRNDLSIVNDILVKGTLLVIPSELRVNILERIHEGHLGIVKCQQRARSCVWWPGINSQIKDLVGRCVACLQFRKNRSEPLIPTPFPDRPWQRLASDLCELNGKKYLVVVDYFSRYFEVALCFSTNVTSVTNHLCSIFARHGVPEVLVTDGGPPFNSFKFTQFSERYGFTHIKSSPKFSQSNGEAERTVQTVKQLLKKANVAGTDPYLAMLSYRSTPLSCGYSPAQLLMGRHLRSPLPILPTNLTPKWPPIESVSKFESENRTKIKNHYDKRKGVRELKDLEPGQNVFLHGSQRATVVAEAGKRAYNFLREDGVQCRRNRRYAVVIPNSTQPRDKDTVIRPAGVPTVPRRSERPNKGTLPAKYRDYEVSRYPLSK